MASFFLLVLLDSSAAFSVFFSIGFSKHIFLSLDDTAQHILSYLLYLYHTLSSLLGSYRIIVSNACNFTTSQKAFCIDDM